MGARNLKKNVSEYGLLEKNTQCLILLCFGVYTQTQYALSCKIEKFKFYPNRKYVNIF